MESTTSTANMPRKFKVFIAEDSPMMRPRLAQLALQVDDFEICGTAEAASEVLKGIDSHAPDALILDIHLRDGNALPDLRLAKLTHPGLLAIVCSNSSTPPFRDAAFAAGANHFLDKSLECQRIPEILESFKQHIQASLRCLAFQ
jgi:DNA-binding NarL/FixJ family response regulator